MAKPDKLTKKTPTPTPTPVSPPPTEIPAEPIRPMPEAPSTPFDYENIGMGGSRRDTIQFGPGMSFPKDAIKRTFDTATPAYVNLIEGAADLHQDNIENLALMITRQAAETGRVFTRGKDGKPSTFESLLDAFAKGIGAGSTAAVGLPPVVAETLTSIPLKHINENVVKLFPDPTGDDWAYTTHQYGPDPIEDIEVVPRWSKVDTDITEPANPDEYNAEQIGRFIASVAGTFDREAYKNMSPFEKDVLYPTAWYAMGPTRVASKAMSVLKPAKSKVGIMGGVPSPVTPDGGHYSVLNKIVHLVSPRVGPRKRTAEQLGRTDPLKNPTAYVASRIKQLDVDDIQELKEIIWNATRAAAIGSTNIISRRLPQKVGLAQTRGTSTAGDAIMGADNFVLDSVDAGEYGLNVEAMARMFDPKQSLDEVQLSRVENMFGSEIAKLVSEIPRTTAEKIQHGIFDTWNAGKALVASIDISGIGNQGWKMAFSPYWKEYLKSAKSAFEMLDPDYGILKFDEISQNIKDHKFHSIVKDAAGDVMDVMELSSSKGRTVSQTEDRFISEYVSQIPGIQLSEQSYTGFLNKLRWDVIYKQLDDWTKQGYKYTKEEIKEMAEFTMISTGRGVGLDKWLSSKSNKVLNAGFFSPRYVVATGQFYVRSVGATLNLAKETPSAVFGSGKYNEISKIYAKTAAGHFIKNAGILSTFATGMKHWPDKVKITNDDGTVETVDVKKDVTIGTNPLKTDYGMISIGPLKYNFWGGDAQMARTFFRMLPSFAYKNPLTKGIRSEIPDIPLVFDKEKTSFTAGEGNILGQRTTSAGLTIDANQFQTLWEFTRNKFAPTTGYVRDLINQQDFLGNEFLPFWEIDSWNEFQDDFLQRFTAILAQDLIDQGEIQNDMFQNPLVFGPSILGFNTQLYETSKDVLNDLSADKYGVLYDDLFEEDDGYNKQIQLKSTKQYIEWEQKKNERKAQPDTEEAWISGMIRYNEVVEKAEAELLLILEQGTAGPDGSEFRKNRKTAIQAFNSTKGEGFRNNIPQHVEDEKAAQALERGTKADIFMMYRSQYWDAELPIDLQTGIPDYQERKRIQEEILTKAEIALGPEYRDFIIQNNPASSNPIIREAVQEYREDTQYLTTNYFDKADELLLSIEDGRYYNLYQQWKVDSNKDLLDAVDDNFKLVRKSLAEFKKALRATDPQIEIAMWRLGDITTEEINNLTAKQFVIELMLKDRQNAR